jgi:hypothetical protein
VTLHLPIHPLTLDTVAPISLKCKFGLAALIFVWASTICFGMCALIDYGAAPGLTGQTAEQWPVDSTLQLLPEQPTLLMFVHPRCPCTRASIGELSELLTGSQGAINVQVLVNAPAEWTDPEIQTDVWQSAAAIPGVTVRKDPEGVEARRFGALTSGQVLVYSAQGQLQFRGGITGARGHSGLNFGRSTVAAVLNEPASMSDGVKQCSVFGCSLLTPSQP